MIVQITNKGQTSVFYTRDDGPQYSELLEEVARFKKELEECRQTVEDVALGTRMECQVCHQYHPCNCDKGLK